ncbi:hypothetical protein [Paraglaciecola arctica]|uniref:Uncharacterized protein n=1 Tax=Paraglaciecola arctica BSs20135 TaxID=493475 RepID=K6YNY3_9ALTE|nr:hypothetical protein [Paraglaciecola arctica]GAC18323.1 hypothetical protein GARC_1347 [Paraglaciecola arctica BSs20135]
MQLDWTCRFGNVKAILQLKKSLNLGEIPDHFQIVANKLLELEGTFSDGFDNNIKYLLNKKNWHLVNCKQGKPPISLKKHCNQYAFDLHCFPIVNDEPQALIKPYDTNSPFKEFNPSSLGPLLSIPQLSDFMSVTIRCGDEADMELLKYAHMLLEQLIDLLSASLQVVENSGQSIQEVFLSIEQQLKTIKTV